MPQTEPAAPVQPDPPNSDRAAKFAWLQGAANAAMSWRLSTAWRGGILLSAVALVVVFLGREGILFGSAMEVVAVTRGGPAPNGVVYYLQKSVIDVQASYELTRCDISAGPNGAPVAEIEARVSPLATHVVKSDLTRGYVIKTNTISGGFWNTDMKLELADGRLVRLGVRNDSTVSVPDFDIPVVTSAGPPERRAPDQTFQAERERICGKGTIEALDKPDAKNVDRLQAKRRFRLEPGGLCPAGTETAEGPARSACILRAASTIGKMIAAPKDVDAQLARYDLVIQLSDIERAPARDPVSGSGIVYRMPGSARLMTCLGDCDGGAGSEVITADVISIPQLGTEASIPVERRLFSNRATELEFGKFGELTSIHVTDAAKEDKK